LEKERPRELIKKNLEGEQLKKKRTWIWEPMGKKTKKQGGLGNRSKKGKKKKEPVTRVSRNATKGNQENSRQGWVEKKKFGSPWEPGKVRTKNGKNES